MHVLLFEETHQEQNVNQNNGNSDFAQTTAVKRHLIYKTDDYKMVSVSNTSSDATLCPLCWTESEAPLSQVVCFSFIFLFVNGALV